MALMSHLPIQIHSFSGNAGRNRSSSRSPMPHNDPCVRTSHNALATNFRDAGPACSMIL